MSRWVILPGLALTPPDYRELQGALDAVVLDAWQLPVTAPPCALRAHFGSEPVQLFGHSLGGLAAIEWALTYPRQVTRIVLADPSPPALPPAVAARAARIGYLLATPLFGYATLAASLGPALRRRGYLHTTGRHDPLPPSVAARYYAGGANWHTMFSQLQASAAQTIRVGKLLAAKGHAGLPVPALQLSACSGERRFAREQRRLAARIGAQLQELDGLSHLFPLTHPQVVVRELARSHKWEGERVTNIRAE